MFDILDPVIQKERRGRVMALVWIGVAIIGGVISIALLLNFFEWLSFFQKELRRINGEIERTEGRERAHWKKRKKRLLLSIIPFVRY